MRRDKPISNRLPVPPRRETPRIVKLSRTRTAGAPWHVVTRDGSVNALVAPDAIPPRIRESMRMDLIGYFAIAHTLDEAGRFVFGLKVADQHW